MNYTMQCIKKKKKFDVFGWQPTIYISIPQSNRIILDLWQLFLLRKSDSFYITRCNLPEKSCPLIRENLAGQKEDAENLIIIIDLHSCGLRRTNMRKMRHLLFNTGYQELEKSPNYIQLCYFQNLI